jgi:putative ABC transport system permease protein
VERWGLSQNYGSARYGDSVLTVEYADANWMELGKKPSFTGTLPQAANEILVERAFLDYFEIPAEVGQTIEVNLGNGKQTYTVSGIMDVENDSRMFQLYVSEAFVEEIAQGEPLFEFRLRYTGADSMELEQLKADIAAFLSANDVSEDQIFYSSNYFDMQGFKSGVMKYYIPVAILLLIACAVAQHQNRSGGSCGGRDCCYLFAVSRWGFWLEEPSGLPFSRHIGAGWAICPIWLRPQQPAP